MVDEKREEQLKLEDRLRSALKRLDLTSQFLIQSLYGVLGCHSRSPQRFAQSEEISKETVDGLQADALRALMGYGPKAPEALNGERTLTQTEELEIEIPEVLN